MESDQLYKRKPYKKDSADIKSLLRIKKSLVLTKGILFRKSFTDNTSSKKIIWQLVIPKSHRHQAILGCHDEVGHQGRVRTLSLLRERFFWPNMQVEATQYIAKCPRLPQEKIYSSSCPFTTHFCFSTLGIGSFRLFVIRAIQRKHRECSSDN